MAVFLTLVARPIAVAIGLWPFNYKRNELAYVSWVGLRGAVPVTLAIFPVMMGVPDSDLLFNVAFAVVLLSLLVQGATVPVAARWLKVDVPPRPEPVDMREVWVGDKAALDLLEYRVEAGSRAEGRHPDDVAAEAGGISVRCVALVRRGKLQRMGLNTRMLPGDSLWLVAPDEVSGEIARLFTSSGDELTANASFFGEFVVDPSALAGDLALTYGLSLEDDELRMSVRDMMRRRLGRPAVVGDRLVAGAFVLTVREMGPGGVIAAVGLKCPSLAAPRRD